MSIKSIPLLDQSFSDRGPWKDGMQIVEEAQNGSLLAPWCWWTVQHGRALVQQGKCPSEVWVKGYDQPGNQVPLPQTYAAVVRHLYGGNNPDNPLPVNMGDPTTGTVINVYAPNGMIAVTELDFEGMHPVDGGNNGGELMKTPTYMDEVLSACLDVAPNVRLTLWGVSTFGQWINGQPYGMTSDQWMKQPWAPDTIQMGAANQWYQSNKSWINKLFIVNNCAYFGKPEHDQAVLWLTENYIRLTNYICQPNKAGTTVMGYVNEAWNDGITMPVAPHTVQAQAGLLQWMFSSKDQPDDIGPSPHIDGVFNWGARSQQREIRKALGRTE